VTDASRTEAPAVAPVRPGQDLDWNAIAAYLRNSIEGLDDELAVQQFPKGWANLTYLLTFGTRRLVLRRPPFGTIAPGAHDMAREHMTLSHLWRAFPPAPQSFLHCEDESVIGAQFFVMEYREGVGIWDEIPKSMQHHTDVGRRVGFAIVEAMADLHRVDPASCGLAELGRPQGFVERQVGGWRKRWNLVAPADGLADMRTAAERLVGSVPLSARHAILHNDVKLDNCQFDPEDPDRIRTMFDWDQATLGDPLIDLGILLNYWPDDSDSADHGAGTAGLETIGLPSRDAIVQRYSDSTGSDVSRIRWYESFATWKTAIVRQQLYARYLQGDTTDERMTTLGETVPVLASRALRLLTEDR